MSKKKYVSIKLEELGNLDHLTHGRGGTYIDGNTGRVDTNNSDGHIFPVGNDDNIFG